MEWISVDERLPDGSKDVTLYDREHGVFNGYCWRGLNGTSHPVFYSYSTDIGGGIKTGVTHWMPLPPPPH